MSSDSAETTSPGATSWRIWVGLGALVVMVVAARWAMLDAPLERDEGEYAYMAQQMLRGVPPYESAYSMKLPGTYLLYAMALLGLGETVQAIHILQLLTNLASLLLLFQLVRSAHGPLEGLIAAAAFALFSMQIPMQAFACQPESLLLVPVLAGMLCLRGNGMGSTLLAGMLFAAAVCIKQHALMFAVAGGFYLLWREATTLPRSLPRALKRVVAFGVGGMLTVALMAVWLWQAGVAEEAWHWTFEVARTYASSTTAALARARFVYQARRFIRWGWALWGMAAFGLLSLLWDRHARRGSAPLIMLLVAGSAALSSGFMFRSHYFQYLLPAAAWLVALGIASMARIYGEAVPPATRRPVTVVVALLLFGWDVLWHAPLLMTTPTQFSRLTYDRNPFPDAVPVADYLRAHSSQEDRILIFGSEPEILFLADRTSATRYIYMYPMFEPHREAVAMQEEMIRQVEAADPLYIVRVELSSSWLLRNESELQLFDWYEQYCQRYERVGLIEVKQEGWDEYWDDEARDRPTPPDLWRRVGQFAPSTEKVEGEELKMPDVYLEILRRRND